MTTSGDFVAANSRKVRGYVRAVLHERAMRARLEKVEERLVPYRRRLATATANVNARRAKLTGGQMAAAERILASPAAECLAKPCKSGDPIVAGIVKKMYGDDNG